MTDSQWMALKVGDKIKDDSGQLWDVAELAPEKNNSILLQRAGYNWRLLEYMTSSQWYTLAEAEVKS